MKPARSRLHRALRRSRRRIQHALQASPVGRGLSRRGRRRALHCIGDSHARVFERIAQDPDLLPDTRIDVVWVLGATALGLANPNSRTDALPRFRQLVRRIPHDETLVVLLGEVDCGYLLWYRAQTRPTSVDAEFERSLVNYQAFLADLLDQGFQQLVVATVPPPTVDDYTRWTGLDNARSTVTASLPERAELTRRYNDRLREWARGHGVAMLDYEGDVLDPHTKLVRDGYRDPDVENHHLHPAEFARLMARHLANLGFS